MDKLDQHVLDLKKAEARDLLTRVWYDDFKFCGCGCPEDVMRFIGQVLAEKQKISDAPVPKNFNDTNLWDEINKLLPSTDMKSWVVSYLLDSKGFTEHGGGVGGSWLTGEGLELLEAIQLVGGEEWDTDD